MSQFKRIVKKIVPANLIVYFRRWYLSVSLFRNVIYDMRRYREKSRLFGEDTREKLRASICAHYHVLEKGISMPERRKVFGIEVASSLVDKLEMWAENDYGEDIQVSSAYLVLMRYLEALDGDKIAEIPRIKQFLASAKKLESLELPAVVAGAKYLWRECYLESARGDFSQLVSSRRSVRHFSAEPVPLSCIEDAVSLAQQSPSVCNRQGSKVWWVTRREKIDEILMLQNGNRGFGHLAQVLLVVTCDLSVFEGFKERNQAWIDGGLFAMSLLYALTYQGLGACPLNWCVDAEQDLKFRRATKIPDNQLVIMLIASGHVPEKFAVAASQRNELKELLCPIE